MNTTRSVLLMTIVCAAIALAGCGGGGSAAQPPSFSGNGVKGPVYNATVRLYGYPGGSGTRTEIFLDQLGTLPCSKTNQGGSYTCTIPLGSVGPFVVELTKEESDEGWYCADETQVQGTPSAPSCSDGAALTQLSDPMSTVVVSDAGGTIKNAPITPFTTEATTLALADVAGLSSFVEKYVDLAKQYQINPDPTVDPVQEPADDRMLAILAAAAEVNGALDGVDLVNLNVDPTVYDYDANLGLEVPNEVSDSGTVITGGTSP